MTKNRICIALLLGLLLSVGVVFAQGSGSDWQYCNAFNVVSPEGTPGGPMYGTDIPSFYTTDYSVVSSFTPASPWRRGAYELSPTGEETPVRMSHDNVVLRLDMLSGTDNVEVRGVKLTIWGSHDFDPNEDLAPLLPNDAAEHYAVDPMAGDTLTGVQFYIDKGASAGSDVNILDRIDIMGIAEQILTEEDTVYRDPFDSLFIDRLIPESQWTFVTASGGPYLGWKKWETTIYFRDGIGIPYEGTFNSDRYGLDFYRIWIALQVTGCHDCCGPDFDGGIEGISNSDSFFVEIAERNDIIVYRRLGAIYDAVDMTATLTDVAWDNDYPDPSDATRWARSEMIKGWDEIPPFIANLYPRDEVSTNDYESDVLCDEENDSIFTADSVQPIAAVAWDKGTCVDSAFMEIRYINDEFYGLPSPTNFPGRVDSIAWHSPLEYAYDDYNGGHSTGWEWNIKHSYRDPGSWSWSTSGWSGMANSWTEAFASEVCGLDWCGKDTFYVTIGNDGTGDWLPPFLDGSYVQVTFRVFSRTNNFRYDRPGLLSPGVMNETTWTFKVDLSGPNAELVCPSAEGHDGETREFSSARRSYTIEGSTVYWAWLADSLPTLRIDLTDDYQEVHDTGHHGIRWSGAFGGAGMNWRDFQISFAIEHCNGEWDTLIVDDSYLGDGVWVDEENNGYDATMWVNFEELPFAPFQSGDFVWVLLTRLVDDPDYGQGSQGGGPADIVPSDSWGPAGGADGNYGTQNSTLYGDDHVPVMWEVVGVAPGYTEYQYDTLGVLHIDLEGPTAPDTFYYPPDGWVTSDSFQIITCNIYDQIGCSEFDENVDLPSSDPMSLYNRVSGVYSGSSDQEARICVNLKVRGCDGSWNPYYHDPAYGGSIPDGRTFCVGEPDAIALDITKKFDEWGVRLTYDPYRRMPTQAHFRPGDEVCVTVYAWDNAVTDSQSSDGVAGPGDGWDDDNDPWLGTYDLYCSDGSVSHTVDFSVPSRNNGYDRLDPDYLYHTVRHIARWTFYVDCHAPVFTEADLDGMCNDTLYYKFQDVSADVHGTYCDNYVAKIGISHGELVEGCDIILNFTDTMSVGGPYTDEVIFQDLKFGEVHTAYHQIPGREYQYYHAELIPDPDEERGAILMLYGDGVDATCSFFQPYDVVDWELYAGDSPDVPWYPASEVCVSGGCYRWWHTYDPYSSPTSTFMAWRYGRHDYTDINVDTLGPTDWLDVYDMHDWYNPNWDLIQTGNFEVQPRTWLNSVMWFNDGAYDAYQTAADYNYPPDLTGKYKTLESAWTGYYSDWDLVAEEGDMDAPSVMEESDPFVDFYAKDLNFIVAEIYTCTDSIIWECLAGSDPDEDTLTGRVPHVVVELTDADGAHVWTIDEWYDCDCTPCFLHYYPERTGCVDWGRLHIGPIDADSVWLYTYRRFDTLAFEPDTIIDTVLGYLDGDVINVTLTFNAREPNDFAHGAQNYTKHVFNWSYQIDMKPPTALFLDPGGTTGYEEVNCNLVHDSNNTIRLRLQDIYDDGVGCAPGLTVAPGWSTVWPIPAVDPATDWVKYEYGTAPDEDAGMVYNPGTEPYYYWTNDGYNVHNCAREVNVAQSMALGTSINIYHGLDRAGSTPVPVTTTVTDDTIFIADSVYAEAVIQDRLGNTKLVTSRKTGLDNGLPKVKGFALSTMAAPIIGTDSLGDPIYGDPVLNDWDDDLYKLPWEVPDQDSIVGIYNFADVCTVFVRLWFNDNMDMREADHLYGHIVRFQPQGWTHWFPVLPVETVGGGSGGLHYPLASYYVDYRDIDMVYPSSFRPAPGSDETPTIPGSVESYDAGWNSDREWIGYMVLAGGGAMDGIGKLRVQGFDDNANNYMMPVEYPIRVVTGTPWGITLEWPRIDEYDTAPTDPWSGEMDDQNVLSGWSVSEGDLEDSTRCSYDADPRETEVTGFWDNSLAETDSVVFKFWWSTEPFDPGTTLTDGYTFHWVEDNMYSENIWIDGENTWVKIPTEDLDILHEYYTTLGGAPTLYSNNQMYIHIVMEAYSRFRPTDPFLTTTTRNILIDNKRVDPFLTYLGGGEVVHGDHTVLPYGSTKLTLCWGGTDVDQIDKMGVWLHSLIDGSNYSLYPDDAQDGNFASIEATAPLYYDPTDSVICLEYENPDGIPPGMWTVSWKAFDAIHNVVSYSDGMIDEYWTYYHSDCEFDFFDQDTLTILRPPFVARGSNLEDALMAVSAHYPSVENSDDIFPWWDASMENEWPDWPTWGWIDVDAIGAIDTLPDFYRLDDFFPIIQVTTFNNPDYTSSDPLMHSYTETGGYPGDSLYVILEQLPADSGVEYIDLNIADYWGGDISGSNPEIIVRLDDSDVYSVGERNFWVYKWTVDDQDNRYDGLVKITATEHTWSYVSSEYHDWDHVGYLLLDTYDPSYDVSMLRDGSTVPFRVINTVDYPEEEYIWAVNEGHFNLIFDWDETMFDPAAPGDPVSYYNYSDYVYTRMWDIMRLSIDGMPIYGSFDDANDHLESRLWDDDRDDYDIHNLFWRQPDYMAAGSPTSYDDATGFTFTQKLNFFADNIYSYDWDVAGEPEGLDAQGIAYLLIKGRDAAGNILDYDEARTSDAVGKLVLVDIEDPEIDGSLITATGETFTGFTGAFDDNYLDDNFTDMGGNGYVYIIVTDTAGAMLGDTLWVDPTGAVATTPWVGAAPNPGDVVTVHACDLAGNETTTNITVVPEEHCCSYALCPDWNLIGVSVMPDPVLTIGDWFPGMTVYRMVDGDYVAVPPADPLVPGEGLAVYPDHVDTITICGVPVESFSVDLVPGWNLVGATWENVDFATPHTVPSDAVDATETRVYDCGVDYVLTDTLWHCRGHLVMALDSCTLEVPGDAGRKVVYTIKDSKLEPEFTGRLVSDASTVTFGAARGATAEFDRGVDHYAIPERPGDVRMVLGSNLDTDIRPVENVIQWDVEADAAFEATVELSNSKWAVSYDGSTVEDGSVINVTAGTHKLVANRIAIPEAFALHQNLPNPFNATTVISYDVPVDCQGKLEVYSVLGQKITTLIDGDIEAGYRSVVWDGTDSNGKHVPSGIYFYKLDTGAFKATSKMTLMK